MSLSTRSVESVGELQAMSGQWAELLDRSSNNEPTSSPQWLLPWWDIFGKDGGRRLRVCAVFDGQRLIGLLPLLARVFWYRPGIPFRRLELLGSGEDEADEIASEYIGLIAETGREHEVAGAVARGLEAGDLGAFDELVLARMNGDSPSTSALESALAIRSLPATPIDEAPAYYVSLPDSWDGYLAALSSSRRQRLRRALRQFENWTGGQYEVIRAETEADIAHGMKILADLHGERWRAAGRHGAFSSQRFSRFHERVMPVLLERGALELLTLMVKGEPLAAAYNIVWDGRVHFYQSGRKMDVPKNIRPGVVLHALAIQASIAAGHREYDFLAGSARYKQEMSTAKRPLSSVRATRPALIREHARRLVRRGARTARQVRAALRSRGQS